MKFVFLVLFLAVTAQAAHTGNPRTTTDSFTYAVPKYDILWVLDNGPTMATRRTTMRNNVQAFVDALNANFTVDYNMAVTDTDWFSNAGALVAASTSETLVNSNTTSMPVDKVKSMFDNINGTSYTSFWEQGLASMRDALLSQGANLVRTGSFLAVILASDEEDYSCGANCYGIEPENNPGWTASTVASFNTPASLIPSAPALRGQAFFPIVVTDHQSVTGTGIGGTSCGATVGGRYMQLTQLVGGISRFNSVCDVAASMTNIASQLRSLGVVLPLTKTPRASSLRVYYNGVPVTGGSSSWIYDAAKNAVVILGGAPAAGTPVTVTYDDV